MRKKIVGRNDEIKILKDVMQSKEAEFVAIYGHRRVGKTFLIRNFFSSTCYYLEVTGIKDASLSQQLENFTQVYSETFYEGINLKTPLSWHEAFGLITKKVEDLPRNKKVVVFLDELPWMASRKSKLLQSLDFYWNRYWSSYSNFILIVCGSAASWMLQHLIHAKGGLYNRITKRIHLEPFSLKETEAYLKSRGINLNRKAILDLYMVMGGIPFYLREVQKGRSAAQIIDQLCFHKKGILHAEFNIVFRSLFDQAEMNLSIVREIAKAGNTISREQLIQAVGASSGGVILRRLEELEASNFIQRFVPYGRKRRDMYFRVIDEYTLFYLKWIDPRSSARSKRGGGEGYWQKVVKTSSVLTWAGFAFESICFKHASPIATALGLDKIACTLGSWHLISTKKSKDNGAQIDLLFDREDDAITVCEIKYSHKPFVIDKAYARALDQKKEVFSQHFPSRFNPTKKHIFLAMITTFGIKKNMYSEDLVENEVILDDLFA